MYLAFFSGAEHYEPPGHIKKPQKSKERPIKRQIIKSDLRTQLVPADGYYRFGYGDR